MAEREYRTKSGRILTDEDIQKLADEAEAGYDVERLGRHKDVVHYFKDGKGEYRWHRIAENGRIVSESGEGYDNEAWCIEMATALNPGIEIKPHEEE